MDTSVLNDSDIAEYLELHSENIIPSRPEDEECSLSGDELFEVDFAQQNISEVNAWLCYMKSVDGKMDLLSFKSSVANTLIAKGLCDMKNRGRPSSMSPNNTPTLKKK
ncbi:hypothetical protein J6590_102373 [Homalodisca vitripennis]|nr:hypothetical protein J6590_102373 [Homalodisca vitripennis]